MRYAALPVLSILVATFGFGFCEGLAATGSEPSVVRDDPRKTLVVDFTPGQRQVSLAGVVLMRQGRGREGIADELNRIYGQPSECVAQDGGNWRATWSRWRFAIDYAGMAPGSRCSGAGRFAGFVNPRQFVSGDLARGWVARTSLGTMRVGTRISALPRRLRMAARGWISETGDTRVVWWRLGPRAACVQRGLPPFEAVARIEVSWYVDNPPRVYGFEVKPPGKSC